MAKVDLNILQGNSISTLLESAASGMFPLVQILHDQGYYITGSDNNEGDNLAIERSMGIPVMMGQRAENIQGADLIVYTAAILPDNEELVAARASGVPVLERSQLLGLVTSWYDSCICVSGTHGKTTTTSMLTQILLEGGMDPSAVIGGKLPLLGGSGRVGKASLWSVKPVNLWTRSWSCIPIFPLSSMWMRIIWIIFTIWTILFVPSTGLPS